MSEPALLFASPSTTPSERFDDFIEWARPFGSAGINRVHAPHIDPVSPYFQWAKQYFAHGDQQVRSWFLRYEYLDKGRLVFTRSRKGSAKILLRDGLFPPGRFLEFSKAYLNFSAHFRNVRTPLKPLVRALCFLEFALRLLNGGNNDPVGFSAKVFEKAQSLLLEFDGSESVQYDVAKEMEILAGMIQGGYHSKTFRFAGRGFRLLGRTFAFTSSVRGTRRLRAKILNDSDLNGTPARMMSEDVAAVGIAYRRSLSRHGPADIRTFMAALAGLALTTVSMRVSDILTLRRDAIYVADETEGRRRIRLARPKIGASQDLPLSKKLGALAEELFSCLLTYSADAHNAMKFYLEKYGANFHDIDEVYIPDALRPIFELPFLTVAEVHAALRLPPSKIRTQLPMRARELETVYFVERPGDVWVGTVQLYGGASKMMRVHAVRSYVRAAGFETTFPPEVDENLYVSQATAVEHTGGASLHKKKMLLRACFTGGKLVKKRVRTSELKKWLLEDFKDSLRYPHWPYTTKERTTRFDEALLLSHQVDFNSHAARPGEMSRAWWQPIAVSATSINLWINRSLSGGPPYLFEQLDVKLGNGQYPSITLHQTRKFHHTQALLAGAHEVFVDELAGRRSGRQSDHYDKRTPREILRRSIDTFDPDEDFTVSGPVAERAHKIKLTDRAAFLFQNAAPKHITDIGGCATDWSLEPCKQYGDCLRCDEQVWRKGDEKRLPTITAKRLHASKMIQIAQEKLVKYLDPPHSLLLQLKQFEDDLARCDAILAAEADESIEVGTIVTFSAPAGVVTMSGLTEHLANKHRERLD